MPPGEFLCVCCRNRYDRSLVKLVYGAYTLCPNCYKEMVKDGRLDDEQSSLNIKQRIEKLCIKLYTNN